MGFTNIWLRKTKEIQLLKIVEWAQRNKIKVENLTEDNINDALRDAEDQRVTESPEFL
jgi:hypothetical protein